MTINKVIKDVDELKPNTIPQEIKAGWLISLEGRISLEILKQQEPVKLEYPDDGDTELLVPFPYDDLYEIYLSALVDENARDFDGYNNNMIRYNQKLEEYRNYVMNSTPSPYRFRNII